MSHAVKGLLWSALVFPGTGHLVLKKTWQGILLMAIGAISLWLYASHLWQHAVDIANQVVAGQIALNVTAIGNALDGIPASEANLMSWSLRILLFCWLIGMADAWRQGRRQDSQKQIQSDS